MPFPADRKAIDIGDYYGDWRLVNTSIGWEPKIDLKEGLRRSLAFYEEHGDRYWEAS